MANQKVARRYAKGLFAFTQSEGNTAEEAKDMTALIDLIDQSADLRDFLKTPILDYRKKQTIADQLFKTYQTTTQKFINVVIQHGRESNLKAIAQQYIRLVDNFNHVKNGLLIMATELPDTTIDKIVENSGLLGKDEKLKLTKKIDTSIIGGYIFQVGDKQIDASVRSKFNNLKNEFDSNFYLPKI